MPKFTKTIDELETLSDKWIFFLKSASDLQHVPAVMDQVPELWQAFSLAKAAILTPDDRHDRQQQEFHPHSTNPC